MCSQRIYSIYEAMTFRHHSGRDDARDDAPELEAMRVGAAQTSLAATFRPRVWHSRARMRAPHRMCAVLDDDTALFMVENLQPWVTDVEGANKSYEYMLKQHGRRFNVEKATRVIASLKAEHAKIPGNLPFCLPKTWPGMLLVLERCGDKVD